MSLDQKFYIRSIRYYDKRFVAERITAWEVFYGNLFDKAFSSWEQARIYIWAMLMESEERGNR